MTDQHGVLFEETEISRRKLIKTAAAVGITLPAVLSVSPASAAPRRGGSITVGHASEHGGKEVLDPAAPTRFWEATSAIYNKLVRRDDAYQPSPDLAVSWSSNKALNRWTFRLRDNVEYHNGKPFSSADVVYSFRHLMDPKLGSPGGGLFIPLVQSIQAPNPRTVVFNLKSPHAEFPSLLQHFSCYIIPEGSVDTIATTGIGTGPFKLASFRPGGETVITINENSWDRRAALDEIRYIGIPDAQARVNALLANQVQLLSWNLDFASARRVTASSDHKVLEQRGAEWHVLVMRTDKKPFNDVRVRQAMKHVVNPAEMIKLVTQGHAIQAGDNPVLPWDPYRLPFRRKQNIARAKALLASAGYRNGLDVELFTAPSSALMVPIAVAYKSMAAKAGIDVKIQQASPDTYWSKVWFKEPFCVDFWSYARSADLVMNEIFRSGAKSNETFWKNRRFDRLLDSARRAPNRQQRKKLYQDAQRLLIEESGAIVPFFGKDLHAMNKRVNNFVDRGLEWDWRVLSLSS